MTLLLREVGRFLVESGLWLATLSVVAAAVAVPVLWLGQRRIDARTIGIVVLAAAGLAAMAHRLGVTALSPHVGGRPLPLVWAAVGSLAAAAVVTIKERARHEP